MKVRIKNPIWGVPITILNDLCSDGLLHFEAPLKKKVRTASSDSDTATTTRICQSTARHHTSESSFNVYRIVGIDRYVEDNPNYGKRFRINGKEIYARILIQRV